MVQSKADDNAFCTFGHANRSPSSLTFVLLVSIVIKRTGLTTKNTEGHEEIERMVRLVTALHFFTTRFLTSVACLGPFHLGHHHLFIPCDLLYVSRRMSSQSESGASTLRLIER
jgi:hypothetical protein